jgi:hypothetical protein
VQITTNSAEINDDFHHTNGRCVRTSIGIITLISTTTQQAAFITISKTITSPE